MRVLHILTFTWWAGLACAQQLSGGTMGVTFPGLSASCQNSLNTSVNCPFYLSTIANNGIILGQSDVSSLCVNSCYTSLQSARSTIAQACTNSTDLLVYNTVAYPATYIIDNWILAYNMSCRTDKNTGAYCDPQLLAWSNQTYLTVNQSCSDCWLGVQSLQLSNPLGYDPGLASNFASLTSACNATAGYAFTSPTAYALNSTATTVPASVTATPPPACTGSYTVQATDTCYSVSQALNVSTYNLLYYNNLDIYCQNFAAAVGSSLCTPPQCQTYTWQPHDTCGSVVSNFTGMTIPQFLAWNPNFNSLCQNVNSFLGYQVCLSPPGGSFNYTTSSNLSVTTAATTIQPAPTNAMTGSTRNCGNWYTVIQGDTCGLISTANSISLSDFYFLNPELNVNCTNLELGEAYCIEPVGNIQTYSGYKTSSAYVTVAPASFSSVNTYITTTSNTPYTYTTSLFPTASGTIPGCFTYQNYNSSQGLENDCSYVAFAYQISTDQLLSWNPSLPHNLSTCALQSGLSYCVQQTNATLVTNTNNCVPVNASSIVSGTTQTCDCFVVVHGYDNASYPCADLESDYSVSPSQLVSWNSWLGSNCDTNLYANLAYNSQRPVCVGVNATAPVGTATSPSTITTTGTKTTASMGPTASGEVAGCVQYYTVQSGDSCAAIETQYGISFSQFYAWNPSIGSNCQSLLVGFAYCVQGPATSTITTMTATATSSAGPGAPTQSGIASNCDLYYTVQSGDSCSKIETQFNDTFAQLYQWNPAIGSNCQSLWVGYAICVGVSS